MIAAVLSGIAAGSTHVVTGPDHLAAVLPLSGVGQLRQSVWIGFAWGIGHGAGVIGLALAWQLLRHQVDPARIGSVAEILVGVLLVVLGGWTLWSVRRPAPLVIVPHGHAHAHAHVLRPHTHAAHGGSAAAFGVLHGLGGTGHLLGVLPTLALPASAAVLYVAGYLLSAITVMMGLVGLVSVGMSTPDRQRAMRVASGVLAVVVGGFWVVTSVAG